MKNTIIPLLCLLSLFSGRAIADGGKINVDKVDGHVFKLREDCPLGFERLATNRCQLRTLYQFYSSVQDLGIGGARTALPPHRDNFSPQQIDLGRLLFFDPLLSGDSSTACASCHNPYLGFADGQPVSTGVAGEKTLRSAPALWNSAFLLRFFWDARAQSLEQQAMESLFSPVEMQAAPASLLDKLQRSQNYVNLFAAAFPVVGNAVNPAAAQAPDSLSLDNVYSALAAFQTSLVSLNSRYDQYVHGNHAALTAQELTGLNVFRSFVARCAECHTPPLFTNNQVAVIGAPKRPGAALDIGAEKTFGSAKLKGAFKVPTLRNIATTAPYMHDGVFSSLREVVAFYNGGRGHAVPENTHMQLHWHITDPELQQHELDALVAFLHTLTDQYFMPDIPVRLPSGLAPVVMPFASRSDE